MTLTIQLRPDIERSLPAKALVKGVSLTDSPQEILARSCAPFAGKAHGRA